MQGNCHQTHIMHHSAASDAVGGPSMQISMQFLLQLVKGFLRTDGGWSGIKQNSTINHLGSKMRNHFFAILITICNHCIGQRSAASNGRCQMRSGAKSMQLVAFTKLQARTHIYAAYICWKPPGSRPCVPIPISRGSFGSIVLSTESWDAALTRT